jgi:hypothetical protein
VAPGCGYESGTRRRIRSRREQTVAARSNSELVKTEPSLGWLTVYRYSV